MLTAFFIGLAVAVVAYVLMPAPPSPPIPEPAKLSDFDFPQNEETATQGVVFGDVWVPDWQVLNYGQFRSSAVESCADGGKK